MKNITLRIIALCLMFVVGCTAVAAMSSRNVYAVDLLHQPGQVCNNPDTASGTTVKVCTDNQNGKDNPLLGPSGILTTVVKILSIVVGIAAIITVVVSGLRMVISGGDPNSVASARQGLIYALVGLAVASLAQVIVAFVLNKV